MLSIRINLNIFIMNTDNLKLTLAITGGVVCVSAVALTFTGFATTGIVAKSVAASMQSSVGNVVAGSAFSVLQSLGAHGIFVKGAFAGAATTVGAYTGNIIGLFWKK